MKNRPYICYDCMASTSGRCSYHSSTFITTITNNSSELNEKILSAEIEALKVDNDKLRADLEVAKKCITKWVEYEEMTIERDGPYCKTSQIPKFIAAAREALAKLGDKPEGE